MPKSMMDLRNYLIEVISHILKNMFQNNQYRLKYFIHLPELHRLPELAQPLKQPSPEKPSYQAHLTW